MGDRPSPNIRIEQARIQHKNLNERREPKLPGFQDHIAIMHVVPKIGLRPIELKLYALARLVGDPVEVINPPSPVAQKRLDAMVFCLRCY